MVIIKLFKIKIIEGLTINFLNETLDLGAIWSLDPKKKRESPLRLANF